MDKYFVEYCINTKRLGITSFNFPLTGTTLYAAMACFCPLIFIQDLILTKYKQKVKFYK